jgi:hypothetical protein
MVIGASDAALEDAKVGFHGVAVSTDALHLGRLRVFLLSVVGGFVQREFRADLAIVARAVRSSDCPSRCGPARSA